VIISSEIKAPFFLAEAISSFIDVLALLNSRFSSLAIFWLSAAVASLCMVVNLLCF